MLQNDPLWKTVFYGWSFACYTAICHGAVACTMPKRLVDHNANILSSSKKFAYILYSFFAALFPTPPGSLHSPLSLGAGANAFSHFYVIIHFSFLCFQLSTAHSIEKNEIPLSVVEAFCAHEPQSSFLELLLLAVNPIFLLLYDDPFRAKKLMNRDWFTLYISSFLTPAQYKNLLLLLFISFPFRVLLCALLAWVGGPFYFETREGNW